METALGVIQHHQSEHSWFFADSVSDMSDLTDIEMDESEWHSPIEEQPGSGLHTLHLKEVAMTPTEAELSEIQHFFYRVFLDKVFYYQ